MQCDLSRRILVLVALVSWLLVEAAPLHAQPAGLVRQGNAAASQPGPSGAAPRSEAAEDQRAIEAAFCTDPRLHGAWIDQFQLDPNAASRTYQVRAVVDRDLADEQLAALEEMLGRVGRLRYKVVEVVRLPIRRMLTDLNSKFESDRTFDGCYLTGAFFQRGAAGYSLHLLGRVPDARLVGRAARQTENDDKIRQAARRYPDVDPVFAAHKNAFGWDTRSIAVEPPDAVRAQVLFVEGLDYFWKCRYPEAESAFALAAVDSPGLLEYRYWRIVALLRQGNCRHAKMAMLATTSRDNGRFAAREYRRVLWSLERIQGAERRELVDLERQARVNFFAARFQPTCAAGPAADATAGGNGS
jgi:hypothetical protein